MKRKEGHLQFIECWYQPSVLIWMLSEYTYNQYHDQQYQKYAIADENYIHYIQFCVRWSVGYNETKFHSDQIRSKIFQSKTNQVYTSPNLLLYHL